MLSGQGVYTERRLRPGAEGTSSGSDPSCSRPSTPRGASVCLTSTPRTQPGRRDLSQKSQTSESERRQHSCRRAYRSDQGQTGETGQGKVQFLTDYTREQLQSLSRQGMLEPVAVHAETMEGKVLALFFWPSTRTRFSTGGRHASPRRFRALRSNPTTSSSTARANRCQDPVQCPTTPTSSPWERPNENEVFPALPGARVPVISGGWATSPIPRRAC